MTKVTLHGQLAQRFGAEWNLLIDQPREAVAAIQANTKGAFYDYLRDEAERTQNAVRYRFIVNGRDHEELQELYLVGPVDTIDIVPVMEGASAGLWQTILGVVLIVVGVVIAAVAGWTGVGLQVGVMVGLAGLSMVLGGVAQMLSPSPTFNPNGGRTFRPMSQGMGGEEERGNNKQTSYLFSGAANTTQQGNPVPIIYGEMVTGSHLVSIGMSTSLVPIDGEDRPPATNKPWQNAPVWDIIETQVARAALLSSPKTIKAMGVTQLQGLAATFHLPATLPINELRKHLVTLHYVFNGGRKSLTKQEAKSLWKILPGPPVLGRNEKNADKGDFLLSIGNYYVTNP